MSQQERFSIECLEPSPKSSFWPIAKDTTDPVNQSNFHDQIRVAKQRAGKHEWTWFPSDWMIKRLDIFLSQSCKPKQMLITFDTRAKTALFVDFAKPNSGAP